MRKSSKQFSINDIEYLLGEINGKLEGICQRLDKINGRLDRHDSKINELESFRDNLQGKLSIISSIGGFIGGIISFWFSKLFK